MDQQAAHGGEIALVIADALRDQDIVDQPADERPRRIVEEGVLRIRTRHDQRIGDQPDPLDIVRALKVQLRQRIEPRDIGAQLVVANLAERIDDAHALAERVRQARTAFAARQRGDIGILSLRIDDEGGARPGQKVGYDNGAALARAAGRDGADMPVVLDPDEPSRIV